MISKPNTIHVSHYAISRQEFSIYFTVTDICNYYMDLQLRLTDTVSKNKQLC